MRHWLLGTCLTGSAMAVDEILHASILSLNGFLRTLAIRTNLMRLFDLSSQVTASRRGEASVWVYPTSSITEGHAPSPYRVSLRLMHWWPSFLDTSSAVFPTARGPGGPSGGTAKSAGRGGAVVCGPSGAAKVKDGRLWAGRRAPQGETF